jgi:hypothetical protein
MASASFRDSMSSLGWSRREPEPVNTSSPSLLGRIQNLNPFGEGGYVRLPITETNPGAPLPAPTRREEEEGWFARKSCPAPVTVVKHSYASARPECSARTCPADCTSRFPLESILLNPLHELH